MIHYQEKVLRQLALDWSLAKGHRPSLLIWHATNQDLMRTRRARNDVPQEKGHWPKTAQQPSLLAQSVYH